MTKFTLHIIIIYIPRKIDKLYWFSLICSNFETNKINTLK